MLITLKEVVTRVQSLVDDDSGSWCDEAYLATIINQGFDDLANRLSSLDLQFETAVVEIEDLPAETASLADYLAVGGVLENMLIPESLEWKRPGEAKDKYKPVFRKSPLPDDPANLPEGVSFFEYRDKNVFLSKSSIIVDLRVRFQQMTVNLADPDDRVYRGITNVLAYRVAELVAIKRGNPVLKADMIRRGDDAQENFEVLAVKEMQRESFRMGSYSRRRRLPPFVSRG